MLKDISYKQLFFLLCIVVLCQLLLNLCLLFWVDGIKNIYKQMSDGNFRILIYTFTGLIPVLANFFMAPIYYLAGRYLVRRKYRIGKRKITVCAFSCFVITMLISFIMPEMLYYGIMSVFIYTVNLMFFLLGFADFIE